MKKYTNEEIEAITTWAISMIKFWGISSLLYIAVIHDYTLAWWIIGSLCVQEAMNWYKAKEKESENDKNN